MLWRFRHTVHATSPPIWTEKPVTPRAALARLVGVRRNYGRSDTQLISAPRLRQGVLRHQPNQVCPAEARLADATQPTLVVMGEQDPDFPDPRAEADWIALTLHAETRPLLPYLCGGLASSARSGVVGVEPRWGGGAWARSRVRVRVLCARAPSLTSVHDRRVGSGVGDMMCDGVIPLGEALRPLGLSGPST